MRDLMKFENKQVRSHWDADQEKWYFSVVDVIAVLTDSTNYQTARNYWKVLKNRLNNEGNETVTNCNRLKMRAADGKMRMTDVADTEQLLRLNYSYDKKGSRTLAVEKFVHKPFYAFNH